MRRRSSTALCGLTILIASGATGCSARQRALEVCAIARPTVEMLIEQADEACRAALRAGEQTDCGVALPAPDGRALPTDGPLLPATYEWIREVDRTVPLLGDD